MLFLKIDWFHWTRPQKSSGSIVPFSKTEWFHGTIGTSANAGSVSTYQFFALLFISYICSLFLRILQIIQFSQFFVLILTALGWLNWPNTATNLKIFAGRNQMVMRPSLHWQWGYPRNFKAFQIELRFQPNLFECQIDWRVFFTYEYT